MPRPGSANRGPPLRRKSLFLRRVLAMSLLILSLGWLGVAYGTLSNLWGYQDSSTAFYIAVASVCVLFATLSAVSAIVLLRR